MYRLQVEFKDTKKYWKVLSLKNILIEMLNYVNGYPSRTKESIRDVW